MSESYHLREEAKALQKSDDGVRGLVVGNDVYEALNFADESTQKILRFTARQYKFLHAYRLGTTLVEAANKSGMSPESAERFLKKEDTVLWLNDRALKDHIKNEWGEPGKWYSEMDRLYHTDEVPKHKIEILKEFGDRVCPKTSRNADSGKTTIEINIDPDAIARSKERRASIDAEIVRQENVA